MKMASRLIDLINNKKKENKTKQIARAAHICTCSTLFCLSLTVVLHYQNAVLYY